jgi:hypothetical protein
MAPKAHLVAIGFASNLCVALLGCDVDDPDPAEWRSDHFADLEEESTWVVDEGIDAEACSRIEEEANEFLAAAMACRTDAACDVYFGHELVENPCLPMLLCYVPVSRAANLRNVAARLTQLDREYRNACGVCPTALCIDPDRMFSTCEHASCGLDAAPPIEAFTL